MGECVIFKWIDMYVKQLHLEFTPPLYNIFGSIY